VTPSRKRPPPSADERTLLIGWLDLQRAVIHWKCEGLDDEDAHRAVLPSSPLMTMAGLVSHLRWTEHGWFEVLFLDRNESANPQFAAGPQNADMLVADVPIAQLLQEYEAQCAISNEIAAAHSFDAIGVHHLSRGSSLRWMLLHMLEETGRHAGHADAVRELLDGSTGYY
jgi:uncharacterized damage-inducible protein DinB